MSRVLAVRVLPVDSRAGSSACLDRATWPWRLNSFCGQGRWEELCKQAVQACLDPKDEKEIFCLKPLARFEPFTSYVPVENVIVRNVQLSAAGRLDAKSSERARRLGALLGCIRRAQPRQYMWQCWLDSSCVDSGASAGPDSEGTAHSPGSLTGETSAYEAARLRKIAENQEMERILFPPKAVDTRVRKRKAPLPASRINLSMSLRSSSRRKT